MTVPGGVAVLAKFTGVTGLAGPGFVAATGPLGVAVSRGIGCTTGARFVAGVAALVGLMNAQLFFSSIASERPPERHAKAAVLVAELLLGYGGTPRAVVLFAPGVGGGIGWPFGPFG